MNILLLFSASGYCLCCYHATHKENPCVYIYMYLFKSRICLFLFNHKQTTRRSIVITILICHLLINRTFFSFSFFPNLNTIWSNGTNKLPHFYTFCRILLTFLKW
jgi:hypothetical protein